MKRNLFAILMVLFITHCSKEKINVYSIYKTDAYGSLVGDAPNDEQWKNTSFSRSELSLFDELDTANLSGTQLPIINTGGYAYPNPFSDQLRVSASLVQPLNGYIVLKYVVVNNQMKIVQKGAARMHIGSFIHFAILADFGAGNYRLYFTFSSDGHEHFFKSWGNIKKI